MRKKDTLILDNTTKVSNYNLVGFNIEMFVITALKIK